MWDDLSFNCYKKNFFKEFKKKEEWIGLNKHLTNKAAWRQVQGAGRQHKYRKPSERDLATRPPPACSAHTRPAQDYKRCHGLWGYQFVFIPKKGHEDPHFFHQPFESYVSKASCLKHPAREHYLSPLPEHWDVIICNFCLSVGIIKIIFQIKSRD